MQDVYTYLYNSLASAGYLTGRVYLLSAITASRYAFPLALIANYTAHSGEVSMERSKDLCHLSDL